MLKKTPEAANLQPDQEVHSVEEVESPCEGDGPDKVHAITNLDDVTASQKEKADSYAKSEQGTNNSLNNVASTNTLKDGSTLSSKKRSFADSNEPAALQTSYSTQATQSSTSMPLKEQIYSNYLKLQQQNQHQHPHQQQNHQKQIQRQQSLLQHLQYQQQQQQQQRLQYQQQQQPQQYAHHQFQPVNADGVPVDIARALNYLSEPIEEHEAIDLSERLLHAKQEEDEGVQQESDFEGEDFGDLLDLFDIDPDETSLDMNINERQNLLVESLDPEQLNRYEFFRRTNLNANGIKRLVNNSIGQTIGNDFAKLIAGVGKVFVGEIVERAKDVQRKQNEAKVIEQLEYKRKLRLYEKEVQAFQRESKRRKAENEPPLEGVVIEKPTPPAVSSQTTNNGLNGYDSYMSSTNARNTTYNSYKITIPDSTTQLSPDHIREAWRLYQEENNNVIQGRWRKQGGGDGWMFR